MSPKLPQDAVLLVVDVQKGMDVYAKQYNRNNPELERNIARLQAAWRKSGRPIIHVQHLSARESVLAAVRTSRAAARHRPDDPDFPLEDIDCAVAIDAFDFAMRAERRGNRRTAKPVFVAA